MQKKLAIAICLVLVIIIAGVILNEQMNSVPDNPPFTVGNTSGNLNNGGLFCEKEGKIYFANVYDNGHLYSMNSDTTQVECIAEAPAKYINAAGKYLYFYQEKSGEGEAFGAFVRNNGIYRKKIGSTKTPTCLDRTLSKTLALVDNNLYYEHYNTSEGITLYTVETDKGNRHQVCEYDINPACVIDGNIFFANEQENFYLSCFHPSNNQVNVVIGDIKMYQPTYDGNYIYFLNVSEDYILCRYNIMDNTLTRLTSERIDCFNVLGGVIFYQRLGKDPALIRMTEDGSSVDVIAKGYYCNINMTSQYTFFNDFEDQSVYYYTSTYNLSPMATFFPEGF